MKRIIAVSSSILVVIGLIISLVIFNDNNYVILESSHVIKDKSNLVGVVLLQESEGSSTYIEQTGDNADVFPTTGYHINLEKSKCENGGSVSYDYTNKKVLIDTNITDKCYIYFDLGDAPAGGGGNAPSGNYSYNFNIMLQDSPGSESYSLGTYEELQAGSYSFNQTNSYCSDETTLTDNGNGTVIMPVQSNNSNCYLYYDLGLNFADYLISTASTNNHLYHHTSDTTAADYLPNNAGDDSYRYGGTKSTVNDNYVCFGYDINNYTGQCESGTFSATSESAYRIIGVFKDVDGVNNGDYYVKLIKANNYENSYWSGTAGSTNVFNNSTLFSNILNSKSNSSASATELNSGYYYNLKQNGWNDYIVTPKWYVGGNTWNYLVNYQASVVYTNERQYSGTVNTTYKIGLMYPSDYGFAATSSYWTTLLKNYRESDIWLYSGQEWTISPSFGTSDCVFMLTGGYLTHNNVGNNYVVRPVLYLKTNIAIDTQKMNNGTYGTISNPYRLIGG